MSILALAYRNNLSSEILHLYNAKLALLFARSSIELVPILMPCVAVSGGTLSLDLVERVLRCYVILLDAC